VYVTNAASGSVSIIDTTTQQVTATVPAGSGPEGLAFTPDGALAFIASTGSNAVSVIDSDPLSPTYNSLLASIPVGSQPYGVAVTPDGNFAYVTNQCSNNVYKIDAHAFAVVGSPIPVGANPLGIAITPDGTLAFVANNYSASVSVIALASDAVIATLFPAEQGQPEWVAITPDGTRAYVTDECNNKLYAYSVQTFALLATIGVGDVPEKVVIDSGATRAYTSNEGSSDASVVDVDPGSPTYHTRLRTIHGNFAAPEGLALTPDGRYLYVTNEAAAGVITQCAVSSCGGTQGDQ
jgi:YVTN family beta-propeller protein